MKSRLNMISQLTDAKRALSKYSQDTYVEQLKNLISYAYKEVSNDLMNLSLSKHIDYLKTLKETVQKIILLIITADKKYLKEEAEAYKTICSWIHLEPLKEDEIIKLVNNIDYDQLVNIFSFVHLTREHLNPLNYEAFTKAMCYLALLGDKTMDEEEFYIIKLFYDQDFDIVPSTYQQFQADYI